MSEDPTKDLTTDEILRLILNRLTGVETRLGALESTTASVEGRLSVVETRLSALESLVEDRLKDTRPIWQAINARTERIENTLLDMKEQMRELAHRDLESHAAQSRLSSRVNALETRATDGERRAD